MYLEFLQLWHLHYIMVNFLQILGCLLNIKVVHEVIFSLGLNLPSDLQSSQGLPYPKVSSISSLNNPQNSEMKICENMKLTC